MAVHDRMVGIFMIVFLQYAQILSSSLYPEVYMDQECGSTLEVRETFLLRLRNPAVSSGDPDACGLDLQVMSQYRVEIRVVSLNIPSPAYPVCRNYLEIYDGSSTDFERTSMTSRLCNGSSIPKGVLRSAGRFVFLWFESPAEADHSRFEIIISPLLDAKDGKDPMDNAVYISIAVATSVLLLAVVIGMCCCVYNSRKKELQRQRRRMRRQNTIQMTLEVVGGVDNPGGPPLAAAAPVPATPPAYSPATAPPPYSTLPRRHHSIDETAQEVFEPPSPEVVANEGEVTQNIPDTPPPYDEHTL